MISTKQFNAAGNYVAPVCKTIKLMARVGYMQVPGSAGTTVEDLTEEDYGDL